MSKIQQILSLFPQNELRFKGPFTKVVTADLTLSNPSKSQVCFKVKTTAPKQYCVRPNSGLIEPGASVNVAVMLQPFDYDPNEKNRHKFLVQSLVVSSGPAGNQEQWWKDASPEQIMDSKLKCVFELSPDLLQKPTNKADTLLTKVKNEFPDDMLSDEELRNEIAKLREENFALKVEAGRLKRLAESSPFSQQLHSKSSFQLLNSSGSFNAMTLIILIGAVIIGVVVGKLLL